MKFVVLFCLLVPFAAGLLLQNYCLPRYCPNALPHIACHYTNSFAKSCPSDARMISVTLFKNSFLESINTKRNLIAGGSIEGFPPASNMATMQWDDELAAMAALNVKRCVKNHDECHNTEKFRKSGQTLGLFSDIGNQTSVKDILKPIITSWFNEYKRCNMSVIDSYHSGSEYGHFTSMVKYNSNFVGCAASKFTLPGKTTRMLFTCNYASKNVFQKPIYVAGIPASGCKTGRNPIYTNLCSTAEVYNYL